MAKAKTDKNGKLEFNKLKFYSEGKYYYDISPVLPAPLYNNNTKYHNYNGINYLDYEPQIFSVDVVNKNGSLQIYNIDFSNTSKMMTLQMGYNNEYSKIHCEFEFLKTKPATLPVNMKIDYDGIPEDNFNGLKYVIECNYQSGVAASGMDKSFIDVQRC